mgnify:FL=1|tara:strand:- start:201 stop:638 length:438 start_codon:yes stop_codon:yes gene_type:complete
MTDMLSVSSSSLSELDIFKQELEKTILEAQEKVKLIKSEIESRYLERAQDKLRQEGKDFGSVTVNDGEYKVKVNVRKRVEWEPGMLIKVLNSMDEDTARHYVQVKYTVPEAKFNAAPPEIKAALSEARTVFLQGVSVDLERDDNA